MILRLGLFVFLLSIVACNEKQNEIATPKKKTKLERELDQLNWMLGKWKREDTGELALWSKKENSYFGGMMVKINEKEKAVIQEVLSLEGRRDGIYFCSKNKGQSNSRKIEYLMTNENFDAPTFTNTSLNRQISYERIGPDKIKVAEEGTSNTGNAYYYVREM